MKTPISSPDTRLRKRPIASTLIRALEVLTTLLLAAGAAIAVALDQAPRWWGYETFAIWYASHATGTPAGAAVVAASVPPAALRPGDTIVLQRLTEPRVPTVRRIVALQLPTTVNQDGRMLQLKAERDTDPDLWEVQLFGVAHRPVLTVPYAAHFVASWRQHHATYIAGLVLLAGGRLSMALARRWR